MTGGEDIMSQKDELAKYENILQDTADKSSQPSFSPFQDKYMKRKVLSKQEQRELLKKIQLEHDPEALEEMILSNLGLIHYYINRNVRVDTLKHLQYDDIFYEGINGLRKAIMRFDLTRENAFSTYAMWWIKATIISFIQDYDNEIRIPAHMQEIYIKYKHLTQQFYQTNNTFPSDQYILDNLNISKEMLENCKRLYQYRTLSLDQSIKSNEDGDAIADFVSYEDNSYQEIHDQQDNILLRYILQKTLGERKYYILYWLFLSDQPRKKSDIMKRLNISREKEAVLERDSLRILKSILQDINNGFEPLLQSQNIPKYILENLDRIRIVPLEPNEIILYHQLKDILSLQEYNIIYYLYIYEVKLQKEEIIQLLSISSSEFDTLYQSALNKMNTIKNNINQYQKIDKDVFQLNLEPDQHDYKKYQNMSFQEFLEQYQSVYERLSRKGQILIENYLHHQPVSYSKKDLKKAEQEINLHLLNLINHHTIPSKKLYNAYLSYKDFFSLDKQHFIECYIFHKLSEKEFKTLYPDFQFDRKNYFINYYYQKLERIYLQIEGVIQNYFHLTNHEIKTIMENTQYQIPEQYKEVIKLYYGIDCKRYSISAIAEMIGESYQITHDRLANAKIKLLRIYSNQIANSEARDGEKYRPYLENYQYDLTKETRTILIKHLLEQKSYQQISNETGLSATRISNIITDGIRKLDFYRFRIIQPLVFTKNEVEQFIQIHSQYQNSKEIIYDYYFHGKELNTILDEGLKDRKKVLTLLGNFEKAFYRDISSTIYLTPSDYQTAIDSHDSDSVLTLLEKEILSYYQGILSSYNPNKQKLTSTELARKYNMSLRACKSLIDRSKQKLLKQKLGYLTPEFGFYTRGEVEQLLQNSHLPISEFERELLQHLKELNGYPLLSLDELAQKYDMGKNSIKRRYLRAILNIKKYEIGEISGSYSYEDDIKPNLKYFCQYDQNILKKIYKEKIPITKFCQKLDQSRDQMFNIVQNIHFNLEMILQNNPNAHKFNFDFADSFIHSNKFSSPVGNRSIINIYDAFFGTSDTPGISIYKIVDEQITPYNSSTIQKHLTEFLTYIQKQHFNIPTPQFPSYDMISDYYHSHKLSLSNKQKKELENYLYYNQDILFREKPHLPQNILYDIITYQNKELPFQFEKNDRAAAIQLLSQNRYRFSRKTKEILKNYYQIDNRLFMTGKEKRKAIELLEKIDTIVNKQEYQHEKRKQLKK